MISIPTPETSAAAGERAKLRITWQPQATSPTYTTTSVPVRATKRLRLASCSVRRANVHTAIPTSLHQLQEELLEIHPLGHQLQHLDISLHEAADHGPRLLHIRHPHHEPLTLVGDHPPPPLEGIERRTIDATRPDA